MLNPDWEKQTQRLSRWFNALMLFSILYFTVVLWLNQRKNIPKESPIPLIKVDPTTLYTSNVNIIHPQIKSYAINGASNVQKFLSAEVNTNTTVILPYRPMFTKKESYEVGDYVIINYFQIQGFVLDITPDGKYTILYKDNNRTLQTIKVPSSFLIIPTSNYAVNPLTLLIN